ncbi:YkvA family protein [Candidatus Electronema sp. PJ]|uniref:YkvA family protein n=1 Tax=Candidatus Electronema sp. PJ TaxID=3401572 RepID=UPI003AA7D0EF
MAIKQLNPFTRAVLMAKHAWAVFRAKETPRYVKLILGLGLVYIVSPWDIIPEWLPVIGVMDDLTLAALLIAWANSFRVEGDE